MKRKIVVISVLLAMAFLPITSCKVINKLVPNKKPEKKIEVANKEVKQAPLDHKLTITTYFVSSCFVKSGNYIFYINPADDRLYKVRTNLTRKQKVIDEEIREPFFIDGEWIYYTNGNNRIFKPKQPGSLYKCRLDGTNKSVVVEESENISIIDIQDGWIYFSKKNASEYNVYRIRTDGSLQEKYNDITSIDIVSPKWLVWYTQFKPFITYKMNLDGSNKTRILDNTFGREEILVKDWLYYTNQLDNNNLYKVNIDTGEKVKVMSVGEIDLLAIKDGWIYYQYYGYYSLIYKMKEDKSPPIPLLNSGDLYYGITTIDDWIYYNLIDGSNKTIRINTDGTKKQELK